MSAGTTAVGLTASVLDGLAVAGTVEAVGAGVWVGSSAAVAAGAVVGCIVALGADVAATVAPGDGWKAVTVAGSA